MLRTFFSTSEIFICRTMNQFLSSCSVRNTFFLVHIGKNIFSLIISGSGKEKIEGGEKLNKLLDFFFWVTVNWMVVVSSDDSNFKGWNFSKYIPTDINFWWHRDVTKGSRGGIAPRACSSASLKYFVQKNLHISRENGSISVVFSYFFSFSFLIF